MSIDTRLLWLYLSSDLCWFRLPFLPGRPGLSLTRRPPLFSERIGHRPVLLRAFGWRLLPCPRLPKAKEPS